jgi:hypothetical protein
MVLTGRKVAMIVLCDVIRRRVYMTEGAGGSQC